MIFNFFLIIFFQPIFSSIFIFLAPILDFFFKNKNRELILNSILFSFLTDILFLKSFGFFLLVLSSSFLIIIALEKILSHHYFYQKLIYLFVFNLVFLLLFFYLNFQTIFDFLFFLKILLFNLFFQATYFLVKNFFNK